MATKADRGTKRVCHNCRSKFYDLARDPIICPMCQTVYEIRVAAPVKSAFSARSAAAAAAAAAAAPVLAEEEELSPGAASGIEFVPLEDADPAGSDDDAIDGDDIADIGDEAPDIDAADDEETFLEDDGEGDDDMSGIVGGGLPQEEDI